MKRAEARVARAARKRLQDAEKSARLKVTPASEKTVRLGADPGSIFGMKMTWNDERRDCDGSWAWGTPRQWSSAAWDAQIKPKLEEWAKLTWGEIDQLVTGSSRKRHKMHHSMETRILVEDAQQRLVETDNIEEFIFRFRLGNLPRLWGFRRAGEFHLLWYDPNHEIYPTEV